MAKTQLSIVALQAIIQIVLSRAVVGFSGE